MTCRDAICVHNYADENGSLTVNSAERALNGYSKKGKEREIAPFFMLATLKCAITTLTSESRNFVETDGSLSGCLISD